MSARPADRPKARTVSRAIRGSGSFKYDAKKGLWVGRIDLPPDPLTGKRRKREVTAKYQEDALEKFDALKAEVKAGNRSAGRDPSVAEWIRFHIDNVAKLRPRTKKTYEGYLRNYIAPSIGSIRLSKLDPDDLVTLERFVLDKNLSSTTARQAHAIVAAAMASAVERRRLTWNPAAVARKPAVTATTPLALDVGQAKQLLKTVEKDRLATRWAAALLTAGRQGEIIGLEIDRVNFSNDSIDLSWQLQRITWTHGCGVDPATAMPACGASKGAFCETRYIDARPDWENRQMGQTGLFLSRPKTAHGLRTIALTSPLREFLELRIAAASNEPNPYGLVFTSDEKKNRATRAVLPLDGSPIDPSADSAAWHGALDRAQLPSVKLHTARHTSIALMYEVGMSEASVQAVAGHSAITTEVTRGYGRAGIDRGARDGLARLGQLFI